MGAGAALEELMVRQRAVLDVLHGASDVMAARLADAWRLCELAAENLERELAGAPLPDGLAPALARARALAALLAHEVANRRSGVVAELTKVRTARRRLVEYDRGLRGPGASCDVSG